MRRRKINTKKYKKTCKKKNKNIISKEKLDLLVEEAQNTREYIDEDELSVGTSDAYTRQREKSKRRCANCTCSRRNEKQESVQAPPKGGCGNCAKGDAFRCSGCPYYGMPSFKEGEEVQIELEDDL